MVSESSMSSRKVNPHPSSPLQSISPHSSGSKGGWKDGLKRNPFRSKKPLGLPTRGKTSANRLRPTDAYLSLCHAEFIRSLSALYVDVGYGETPQTTLESAARLRRLNPNLRFLGVEIDPARVAAAREASGPGIEFRLGGFNLPLREGERAAVIRAMNVLRQYPEAEYSSSLETLTGYLCDGGFLLEGTSDPLGRMMVFHLYRRARTATTHDSLIFYVRLQHPFSPRGWQAVLPKDLIHRAGPGSSLDKFFDDWETSWRRALRQSPADARHGFVLAAGFLASEYGHPVDRRTALLRRGFLRLTANPWEPLGTLRVV
ncbi:MAG: hypothetical protein JW929_00390 [Anaerolineales bacterium]|nr:hypothetical protein [Anaerolineales bacterium]